MDQQAVYRRAGGRRGHNARRRFLQLKRRAELAERIRALPTGASIFTRSGARARLAEEFGVSRSTITRDVQAIMKAQHMVSCPRCGSMVPERRIKPYP